MHPAQQNRVLPVPLGIIEGYYGRAWSWAERTRVVHLLAPQGFDFFLYAPKAARALRKGWREPVAETELQHWIDFAREARAQGMRFGLGLSPHEFNDEPGHPDWARLSERLSLFDGLVGIDLLALLFDDIRGDDPRLAERQARLTDFVAQRTRAAQLWVCPSYYSDDPVLDRVFGERPCGYLEALGQALDPRIGMFWTGEEVCSRAYDPAHLSRVAGQMRRLPVLWDNYPVNDGQRMSQRLHLRAFTGRPADNASLIEAHAINPALQPLLGCIPALTLAASYAQGAGRYAYGEALSRAATQVLGADLARDVLGDLIALQDTGLDLLGEQALGLQARYARWQADPALSPTARLAAGEIVEWLAGGWRITDEIVRTQ
jgi:hyaluronoglucosaminidase